MKPYNPQTFKPDGIYYGMPMEDYAKAPGLNASSLKLLLESPLTYKRQRDALMVRKETRAMDIGTAVDGWLFSGEQTYYLRPETYGSERKPWNANANECKAWLAVRADKPVFSSAEHAAVLRYVDYIRAHGKASRLLTNGRAQVSVFAKLSGRLFKGRFDYLSPLSIVDLKCVADASGRAFFRQCLDMGWLLQAELYTQLAEALDLPPIFHWIALQKGDQPLLSVRKHGLSAELLGREQLDTALRILDECTESGIWPDFADDTADEIKALEVPEWALNDTTQLEDDL